MTQKVKVLIVVPSLRAGGMERVASTLANHFAQSNNVDSTVYSMVDIEPFFDLDERVKFIASGIKSKGNLVIQSIKTIRNLRSVIKKAKPNAVLSFGDRYNSLTVLSGMFLKSKIFISNRQNPFLSNGLVIDTLNRLFYPFSTGMVAQTQVAKKEFARKFRHKNVMVIGNPFKIQSKTADLTKKSVLNVGRFSDQKNQDELIEVFNNCQTGTWDLNFLGDGPKKQKTLDCWKKSPKKDNIHILDFDKDVEKYYLTHSIFAFTSRTEGFPNALGEAMSYGIPVISYDCISGPSDLIDDGENGFLVKVGDHATYAKRLQLLLDDQDLRIQMGKAAKQKLKEFDIENIANKYLSFILAN